MRYNPGHRPGVNKLRGTAVEQNTAPTDYRALSAEALLDALEHAGRTPDLELVRVCLERQSELTPALLEWLPQPYNPEWPDDDPRHMAPIHAGLLLCAYRETAALPIFERLYHDYDAFEEGFGDWFNTALPNYGPAIVPTLNRLLSDPAMPDFNQSLVIGALVTVAARHLEVRTQVVEQLRALLPPLDPQTGEPQISPEEVRDPPLLWSWAMQGLADLRDLQSQEQILALFRNDLIDEMMIGGEKEYLRHLNRPQNSDRRWIISKPFDLLKLYEDLHLQAARDAEMRAKAEEARARLAAQRQRQEQQHGVTTKMLSTANPPRQRKTSDYTPPPPQPTAVRSQPKVGRNEPCPCGSGRKYKHCHGK
jgi:hypothetical protein